MQSIPQGCFSTIIPRTCAFAYASGFSRRVLYRNMYYAYKHYSYHFRFLRFAMRLVFRFPFRFYLLVDDARSFLSFDWALINLQKTELDNLSLPFTVPGAAGPKEWLKEQKKKASRFLLAPIDASRETLRYAYLMLTSEGSGSEIDLDDIQRLLGSAARDCVTKERNSFVEFQANTGVEVCTFRLLVNNAASLLDDKDPIKLEAEAKLYDVVRSFTLLYDVANQTNIRLSSDRVKVANALVDTISSLDKFEQGIKDCLDI